MNAQLTALRRSGPFPRAGVKARHTGGTRRQSAHLFMPADRALGARWGVSPGCQVRWGVASSDVARSASSATSAVHR